MESLQSLRFDEFKEESFKKDKLIEKLNDEITQKSEKVIFVKKKLRLRLSNSNHCFKQSKEPIAKNLIN